MKRRAPLQSAMVLLALASGLWAADAGLTDLGRGIDAYNARNFTTAITHLKAAHGVTALADYVSYHLAYSELLTGDVDGALAALAAYRAKPVESSPLNGKIELLYSRALLDRRDPESNAKALSVLQAGYKILPQPDGDFAQGLAYEALGEQPQAALAYERVFYSWPNTDLAAQASSALERLRTALGRDFPNPTPRQQLERCEKWLEAKQFARARQEYASLEETLNGPQKDDAKVGIGASDFLAGNAAAALRYLKALRVAQAEADAERLYYVTESARRADEHNVMMDALRELAERYPKSPWRMKALIAAGDHFAFDNDREMSVPLYRAMVESFPAEPSAAYAHWRIAWDAYETGKPDRVALLREQIEKYAADSRAGAALYYLGRIAETDSRYEDARAYYDRLSYQYPHYFYAVLGRERLQEKPVASVEPDSELAAWLASAAWPVHRDLSATEPNAATRHRIERARLLMAAGLPDTAEAEIRFGASTESEQPHLLAMELAQSADSSYRALRIMKSFSADYLALPIDKAPAKFWQMLFPLPWKDEVFMNARELGLDPWDVAALIRQESEFNPSAKSRANAYGLMQLMPATGRMLGRQQGMKAVPTSLLLHPDVSIRLGTHYLRQQLDGWDGDLYRTLAAYNAGPRRVREWLMASNYREPAEFVENIPFNETREYVQAVLRNADIYRELYGGRSTLQPEGIAKAPVPVKLALVSASKPVAAAKPAAAGRPAAASKPAAATKPAAAIKPAAATKPAAASKPAAATKPAAAGKAAASTKPAASAKPAASTKSASVAKLPVAKSDNAK